MDLASKLSSQHARVVILCLMMVRIVVTVPDKDNLWWEKYNEPSDYEQLMQEEIGKEICIVWEEIV